MKPKRNEDWNTKSKCFEELADVDADVGFVFIDSEFLADGAADVDVAPLLHVVAHFFAS